MLARFSLAAIGFLALGSVVQAQTAEPDYPKTDAERQAFRECEVRYGNRPVERERIGYLCTSMLPAIRERFAREAAITAKFARENEEKARAAREAQAAPAR